MHWAYLAAKRDNLESVKIATAITTILGVAFMVGQYLAWGALVEKACTLWVTPQDHLFMFYRDCTELTYWSGGYFSDGPFVVSDEV
jgi:heme/copper-type cytochrome/quinol oxidase subunit 3